MASSDILDDYYLAFTAIVTIAYQLSFFILAFAFEFDKVTDLAGGSNFILNAILTLSLSGRGHPRQLVASLLLILWAARLTAFLFYRILRSGTDHRFDKMRSRFFAFFAFWTLQAVWVWSVSLPVTVLNSPNIVAYPQHPFGTPRDIAGIVLFALGFLLEAVSDGQKYRFRCAHDSKAVCDGGLFAFSRHPNYFGEIIMHFAIYTMAVSSAADGYVAGEAYKALYATIVGPIFLTLLLLFVSGLPPSERPKAKSRYEKGDNWDQYRRWLDRTSILIPFPPRWYAKMPLLLKRTLFLEFPIYVFDPAKHSTLSRPEASADDDDDNQDAPAARND